MLGLGLGSGASRLRVRVRARVKFRCRVTGVSPKSAKGYLNFEGPIGNIT